MHNRMILLVPVVTVLILTTTSCDEQQNKRLADMAERHLVRQAEQNRQMSELQREVAEGSRRLVEADAQSRKEMVSLQRGLQSERIEIGRQRDLLEGERRDLAAKRHLDPIVAVAISSTGLLLACLLPMVVVCYLLHRRVEPADDQIVAEVLLEDMVSQRPLLLPPMDGRRAIDFHDGDDSQRLPEESNYAGESD